MNGDRMSDVVRIRPSHVIVCHNMGYGSFDKGFLIHIPDTVLTDGPGGQVEKAKLEDINGDGLSDLVIERAMGNQANELWYWLNLGTDSFSSKYVITDMPTIFNPTVATRWADVNGNGTTDLIYADSSSSKKLSVLDIGLLVGGSDHPNLLTGIDNGLGIYTQINYESSTEHFIRARNQGSPWSQTIPFPIPIISNVKTITGLDLDTTPGPDNS